MTDLEMIKALYDAKMLSSWLTIIAVLVILCTSTYAIFVHPFVCKLIRRIEGR